MDAIVAAASARAPATVSREIATPSLRSATSGSTATRPVPPTTIVPGPSGAGSGRAIRGRSIRATSRCPEVRGDCKARTVRAATADMGTMVHFRMVGLTGSRSRRPDDHDETTVTTSRGPTNQAIPGASTRPATPPRPGASTRRPGAAPRAGAPSLRQRLEWMAEAEHQRAAELDAVIRVMGEAVIVCRGDGTIALSNPAADALFPGRTPTSYTEVLDELDDPDGKLPRLGIAAGPIEVATRVDGDRWVELSTYPVRGAPALLPVGETLVVMRDVTQARQRELVRTTFIGVLSHELRTPVTTIYGGAKLLARTGSTLDEDTRRSVFADIYEEAERLQRLVEDIVALNRFGDTQDVVGSEPVLIQRLLPRIAMSEENRWPGVTFSVRSPTDLPTVAADETYVEQVVRNLLSNAAKYSGIGSTVEIESSADDHEVVVRVLDDGPGLTPEEADRLFELFYRSPQTAAVAGGAGIGLFVCARLMAAMGGRIWAAPRPAGGAEFGFALRRFED